MDELPAIGSRWYRFGYHWQVIGHVVRDGEPAIRVRPIDRRKPVFDWIWRLCCKGRHAVIPSGAS